MSQATGQYDLDLGSDHWLTFTCWKPDRALNPTFTEPDDDKIGAIITHKKADGSMCEGSIWFNKEVVKNHFRGRPVWDVQSWEPLTCTPSFLCHCGDHGFIRDGKWVNA